MNSKAEYLVSHEVIKAVTDQLGSSDELLPVRTVTIQYNFPYGDGKSHVAVTSVERRVSDEVKEAIAAELHLPNPKKAARKQSKINPPVEEFDPLYAYGREIGTVSPFAPNAQVRGWYYVIPEVDPTYPVEVPFGFTQSLVLPRDAFENLMFYTAIWHRGERMRIVRDRSKNLYCAGLPFLTTPSPIDAK